MIRSLRRAHGWLAVGLAVAGPGLVAAGIVFRESGPAAAPAALIDPPPAGRSLHRSTPSEPIEVTLTADRGDDTVELRIEARRPIVIPDAGLFLVSARARRGLSGADGEARLPADAVWIGELGTARPTTVRLPRSALGRDPVLVAASALTGQAVFAIRLQPARAEGSLP